MSAGFSGSARLRSRVETGLGPEYTTITVTAEEASIAIDALGKRASVGGRLIVLDLRLGVLEGSFDDWRFSLFEEALRLDVDGAPGAPVRFHETSDKDYVYRGASERVTAVFEAPTDAEELELIVTTNEGSKRIPVEIGDLPPCCGE